MQAPPRDCDMDYFLVWIRCKIHHAVWKGRHPSLLWIMNRDDSCEIPIEIPEEVIAALAEQGKPESGDDIPAAPSLVLDTTATQQAILKELSPTEEAIMRAASAEWQTKAQIAIVAGLSLSSTFSVLMTNLVDRGYLESCGRGYRLATH